MPHLDFDTIVCLWMLEQGLRKVCSVGYGMRRAELDALCGFIRYDLGLRCHVHSNREVVVQAHPLILRGMRGKVDGAWRDDVEEVIDPVPQGVLREAMRMPRYDEDYASFSAWAQLFDYPQLSSAGFAAAYRDDDGVPGPSPLRSSTLTARLMIQPADAIAPFADELPLLTVYHEEGNAQHAHAMRNLQAMYQKLQGQVLVTEMATYHFVTNRLGLPEAAERQFCWRPG